MIIYGIEKYGGNTWGEDSWSQTTLAFATKKLAEEYKAKAELESLEMASQIDDCNSCRIFFDQTDDNGELIIPIEEARAVCQRATVDEDGCLMCYDSGIWGIPHYNIVEIEFVEEETE